MENNNNNTSNNNNINNNTTTSSNSNNSSSPQRRDRRNSQQDDSDEDESEILEESPCGRYLKRREEVENRLIPGIDATFLAMDTEEGVEVVWNEVNLVNWCESEVSKAKEEKIKGGLDQLMQLNHPNIVKLHKHWIETRDGKTRVIFITEYMSSGSLKHFLKKTKRNVVRMAVPAWKRWCTQLLSALCYMHSSTPSIIHGNLSSETISISHTGLIKVDAVTPNAIQRSLRLTRNDPPASLHFVAPEISRYKSEVNCYVAPFPPPLTAAMDIYSFGICALEMAALEIPADADANQVTHEQVLRTLKSLENGLQIDFIERCINQLPSRRPSAKQLLFHRILFEVPSLRLFSAHVIVNTPSYQPEQLTEEALQKLLSQNHADNVLGEVKSSDGVVKSKFCCCDAPKREVEKFLEEVRNGAYPLTAIRPSYRPPVVSKHRNSPDLSESPETFDEEVRRIVTVECELTHCHANTACNGLALTFRLDDQMNRHLNCEHNPAEIFSPVKLVEEMVHYGLVHRADRDIVRDAINRVLERKNTDSSA